MSDFPDHPFWTFSTRHYSCGGVAAACLSLQERRGIDVNILLFCIWAAIERNRRFSGQDMSRLAGAVEDWHGQVVRPLRAARQRMKQGAEGLAESLVAKVRKRVIAAEIECEHIEQLMLAAAAEQGRKGARGSKGAPAGSAPGDLALANIAGYFRVLGFEGDDSDGADVAAILAPLVPDMTGKAAARLLAGIGGKARAGTV